MSLGYACQQDDREHNNVLFAEAEEVSRARQRTFEKTEIANQMAFAGFSQLEPVVFDNDPKLTIAGLREYAHFQAPEVRELYITGLRLAGLPEE